MRRINAGELVQLVVRGVTSGFLVERSLFCPVSSPVLEKTMKCKSPSSEQIYIERDPEGMTLLIDYLSNHETLSSKNIGSKDQRLLSKEL